MSDTVTIDLSGDEPVEVKATVPGVPNALINEDGTVTLTLAKAVSVETRDQAGNVKSREHREFTLREFLGDDLLAMQTARDQADATIIAFSRAASIDKASASVIFRKLKLSDCNAVGKVITFLSGEVA
jgi:hypothetical protein